MTEKLRPLGQAVDSVDLDALKAEVDNRLQKRSHWIDFKIEKLIDISEGLHITKSVEATIKRETNELK